MGPPRGLFGSQQRPEDNVGASDINAGNIRRKNSPFRQTPNRNPPQPWYGYLPSQGLFPSALHFYHPAPFDITLSSQPGSAATQEYLSYGPLWQGHNFPRGGYGGPEMFPLQ
jgi:hypothetical protein